MSFFKRIFGENNKVDEEKQDLINKLIPFKQKIADYDEVVNQLRGLDIENVKHNVDTTIQRFEFISEMESKYGQDDDHKIVNGVFIGMSEEQFDDTMRYKVITGEEIIHSHLKNGITKPYSIRKENILKTKTKVVRSNFRKVKNPNRIDFIFEK